ncbi:hypothetical protein K0M31_016857 [Melipona bicolor]|uniref:Uncharacterized protein n=1 Tax=Melipona bicolor TaxID=60889 RepID=A0AA40FE61_9HYME|nr:hypothetical protein K0M31_016857 [Melipona bicolor]
MPRSSSTNPEEFCTVNLLCFLFPVSRCTLPIQSHGHVEPCSKTRLDPRTVLHGEIRICTYFQKTTDTIAAIRRSTTAQRNTDKFTAYIPRYDARIVFKEQFTALFIDGCFFHSKPMILSDSGADRERHSRTIAATRTVTKSTCNHGTAGNQATKHRILSVRCGYGNSGRDVLAAVKPDSISQRSSIVSSSVKRSSRPETTERGRRFGIRKGKCLEDFHVSLAEEKHPRLISDLRAGC